MRFLIFILTYHLKSLLLRSLALLLLRTCPRIIATKTSWRFSLLLEGNLITFTRKNYKSEAFVCCKEYVCTILDIGVMLSSLAVWRQSEPASRRLPMVVALLQHQDQQNLTTCSLVTRYTYKCSYLGISCVACWLVVLSFYWFLWIIIFIVLVIDALNYVLRDIPVCMWNSCTIFHCFISF